MLTQLGEISFLKGKIEDIKILIRLQLRDIYHINFPKAAYVETGTSVIAVNSGCQAHLSVCSHPAVYMSRYELYGPVCT